MPSMIKSHLKKISPQPLNPQVSKCRPRTRGDGPTIPATAGPRQWSAPHPRGWSPGGVAADVVDVVGPAPAGMVRPGQIRAGTERRRPRTRGDGPYDRYATLPDGGSAPHPRGWSHRSRKTGPESSVGPAYAGMVLARGTSPPRCLGQPRVRGDGPWPRWSTTSSKPSAPHPRGWFCSPTIRPVRPAAGPVARRDTPRLG